MRCQVENERVYYRFEEIETTGKIEPGSGSEPALVDQTFPSLEPKRGFWKRQFGAEVTTKQHKYDWAFGVFLPLVCFYFDQLVFRQWSSENGLLRDYKMAAYSLAFASILAMAAWLLWGDKWRSLNGLAAGLFFVSSLVSLTVGVLIMPLSLLGLIVVVGALGLTPLVSSIVYLRNGVRALRTAGPLVERETLVYAAVFGGLIGIVVPYLIKINL